MYFPYIRGKQFDLIALRESVQLLSENQESISPIIEPVKNSSNPSSTSTLRSTLGAFIQNNVNFNIIVNPAVGDFHGQTAAILDLITASFGDYTNYQIGVIINEYSDYLNVLAQIQLHEGLFYNGFTLIHTGSLNDTSAVISAFENIANVLNNVVDFGNTNRRYYRNFERTSVVSLDDFFVTQRRNSDYLPIADSSFSDEHLYFQEENFKGFADYLTIGQGYSESGFLPYAVAIHLSYAAEDNVIRVKHFVSDSNLDTSDVAGKFAEALTKLVAWVNQNNIPQTAAIREFLALNDDSHFPGLGYLKKLSIMHHIEHVLSLV